MIDIVSRCLMLIEIVRHADRTCKLLGAHALSEFPLESTLTDQPPMYRSVHKSPGWVEKGEEGIM